MIQDQAEVSHDSLWVEGGFQSLSLPLWGTGKDCIFKGILAEGSRARPDMGAESLLRPAQCDLWKTWVPIKMSNRFSKSHWQADSQVDMGEQRPNNNQSILKGNIEFILPVLKPTVKVM